MATVRVLRSNPAVSDDHLAAALMNGTDLDADEAFALVRAVSDAPTEVGGDGTQEHVLRRIATVLEENGFEVSYDA
jgi:hypothetical protein